MENIKKNHMPEQLLKKWLDVTSSIQNERIVQDLTFNEALVCNHLMYQQTQVPDYLTPSELCRKTGIQKSLMNRVLKSLSEQDLIEYVTDINDKRVTPVRINRQKQDIFLKEHNKNLHIVEELVEFWGPEKSARILAALCDIEEGAQKIIHRETDEQKLQHKEMNEQEGK